MGNNSAEIIFIGIISNVLPLLVRLDDDALRRFLIFISFEESSIMLGGAFSHLECFRFLLWVLRAFDRVSAALMIFNLFWPETEKNRKQFASIYWRPLCCWKEISGFKLISILLRHVLNFPEMYSQFSNATELIELNFLFFAWPSLQCWRPNKLIE